MEGKNDFTLSGEICGDWVLNFEKKKWEKAHNLQASVNTDQELEVQS